MDINISNEYGKLKEAIVGIADGMTPSADASWLKETFTALPEAEREAALMYAGKNYSDVLDERSGKTIYDQLKAEVDALAAILKAHGVRVYRPDALKPDDIIKHYGSEALNNGYSQSSPRDNTLIIGNTVIETNPRSPARRIDIAGLRNILALKCGGRSVKWLSMPHAPLLGAPSFDTPILEGGDVIVLGKTILVGNSINPNMGSNMAGYLWLKSLIGEEYNVIRVPLNENASRLDMALSIPREGLVILCPEALKNGIPEPIKNYDIIQMWPDMLDYLALNGLPLDSENYIMGYNDYCDNYELEQELIKRNINVHKLFFGAHNAQGGSVRHAVAALTREA